jgi:lysophospholipase L1-like esterase
MQKSKRTPISLLTLLIAFLSLILLLSLGANYVLFGISKSAYREAQEVRLNPTDAGKLPPVTLAPSQKRLVFAGDSHIAMWSDLPQIPGWQSINRGIGDQTTAQLLLRWETDVLALKPDAVVLEIGTNDIKAIGSVSPEVREKIIAQCLANRQKMLDTLQERHIPVLVMGMWPLGKPPLSRRPVWSDDTYAAREVINAKTATIPVTFFPTDTVLADSSGRLRPELSADFLHPNAAGYTQLNQQMTKALQKFLP